MATWFFSMTAIVDSRISEHLQKKVPGQPAGCLLDFARLGLAGRHPERRSENSTAPRLSRYSWNLAKRESGR